MNIYNSGIYYLFKFLLENASKNNITDMTHIKIQKLAYIMYGLVLSKYSIEIVIDKFFAWKYGPVNLDLYHALKHKGKEVITIEDIHLESSAKRYMKTLEKNQVISYMEEIFDFFKDFSGADLVAETHKTGSPWNLVYSSDKSNAIPKDETLKYYKENQNVFDLMFSKKDIYRDRLKTYNMLDSWRDTIEFLRQT
jgi:uncharacterized phage-associated protein